MRIVLFLLLAPTFVSVIVGGVVGGNSVAEGVAVGLMVPLFVVGALLRAPVKQKPRKADPAKIARMERELETGPAWEQAKQEARERVEGAADQNEAPTTIDRSWPCVRDNRFDPDCEGPHVEADGGTRRICLRRRPAKPLAARTTEDCPRPEGCVIAHPCRKCGADRGQVCVGDLPLDTRALAQPE